MCEFCHQHGEGRKWYLEAKNYSEDLLSDLRRRRFVADFFSDTNWLKSTDERLGFLDSSPHFVRRAVGYPVTRHYKRRHFGQVLPIEDVERIFEFVNSVVRVACICRQVKLGEEKRYCYCVSMGPNGGKMGEILTGLDGSFLGGPERRSMENIGKEQALEDLRRHEAEGLCHTVWTFDTPFIGGICNCDRSDCLAMRNTVDRGVNVMFRAEYVAEMDADPCNGCRLCMRVCQFGAIVYSAATQKTLVDPRRCYGCGICRSVCPKDAIALRDRAEVPVAAKRW